MVLFTKSGTLKPVAPYSFARTLSFLSGFPPLCDEVTVGTDSLSLAISVGDQPLAVELRSSGHAGKPALLPSCLTAPPRRIHGRCCGRPPPLLPQPR